MVLNKTNRKSYRGSLNAPIGFTSSAIEKSSQSQLHFKGLYISISHKGAELGHTLQLLNTDKTSCMGPCPNHTIILSEFEMSKWVTWYVSNLYFSERSPRIRHYWTLIESNTFVHGDGHHGESKWVIRFDLEWPWNVKFMEGVVSCVMLSTVIS